MPVTTPRLIAEVFEHVNFQGRRGYVLSPVRFTGQIGFQDNISSVRVYKGPGYKTARNYKVVFHEHIDFQGKKLILPPGFYPNLHDVTHNFPDRISSISFSSTLDRTGPEWGTVPYEVICYEDVDFKGRHVTILRDVMNLRDAQGRSWFEDRISSIRLFKGPDAPPQGGQIVLYEHPNFEGSKLTINMRPMDIKKEIPNLHILPQSFGDIISGIKISGWSSSKEFTEVVFEDEFDGTQMKPEWQWEDPKGGGKWRERQGYLVIDTASGQDLWWGGAPGRPGQGGNMDAPRLLMQVSGDFAIETRITVTPDLKEHGGLIVWKSPMAYVRLEKTSGAHAFRGDVRFERHVNRVFQLVGRGPGLKNVRQLYLKLERRGNLFSGFASSDGQTWIACGQTFVGMGEPVMLGLHALAPGNIPPTHTQFDYFRLLKRPSEAALYKRTVSGRRGERARRESGREQRRVTATERARALRQLT